MFFNNADPSRPWYRDNQAPAGTFTAAPVKFTAAPVDTTAAWIAQELRRGKFVHHVASSTMTSPYRGGALVTSPSCGQKFFHDIDAAARFAADLAK